VQIYRSKINFIGVIGIGGENLAELFQDIYSHSSIGAIMIRYIQPKAVPESDAPFTQVVLDDTYAHFAGLVAADFPEGLAVLGDVAEETRALLTTIRSMLQEIGLDMERIVRADVHLASLDDFDIMDAAYREFFKDGQYPARTTTESVRLFGGSKVEITCMARLK
jgi:2-iminobutanoate/2-iminopropanoate deaminase